MNVLGVERVAGLEVTAKGSQGMAGMAVGRLRVRELVPGLALLEEPKLGTAEQELQCWEGGVGVWGVKGGGSTAAACLPWQQGEGSGVKGSHCSRGGV